jgi:transcriptional regulator with XRE-family HTH domain
MNELHASDTVAAKVSQHRQERGWSMRELAGRAGLSEDVIEAIENGRRRRGVTVDELMVLAHALETMALVFLPPDSDYFTDEQKQRADAAVSQREAERAEREANGSDWKSLVKLISEDLPKLLGDLRSIPPSAVLAIERDGKLIPIPERDGKLLPVEEPAGLLDGDLGLGGPDVPLDH